MSTTVNGVNGMTRTTVIVMAITSVREEKNGCWKRRMIHSIYSKSNDDKPIK